MCEPTHSINQFPDNDDSGPIQPRIDAAAERTKSSHKGLWEWAKKIMGRLHYSRFGSGHSEGMALGKTAFSMLPEPTRYEANWWSREVHLDGLFRDSRFHDNKKAMEFEKKLALEAATEYANRSSIGNLSLLRRFLENSILQSEKPLVYLTSMVDLMILPKYKDKSVRRIKGILGIKEVSRFAARRYLDISGEEKNKIAKLAVGFTRQRGILVPCWADDAQLWS